MKLRTLLYGASAFVLALGMVGCQEATEEETTTTESTVKESAENTTVTLAVDDAEGNKVDVEFPTTYENGVVVLNYQTLDFMHTMGLGEHIIGIVGSEASVPEYLHEYFNNDEITIVGTGLKDYDIEAIASLQPDVIFSSDRTVSYYDDFSAIAPTYAAYVEYGGEDFMEGFVQLAEEHGKLFGVEDKLDDIIAGYEERIAAIEESMGGQTALLALFTGGTINTLGDEGRCSVITRDMGFVNQSTEIDVNHGSESSYETYLAVDPEWIFVLDKDLATNVEASLATELMDNEIIHQTSAYQNDQIVYLTPGNIWYIMDGGITGFDQMITCIEEAVGIE